MASRSKGTKPSELKRLLHPMTKYQNWDSQRRSIISEVYCFSRTVFRLIKLIFKSFANTFLRFIKT